MRKYRSILTLVLIIIIILIGIYLPYLFTGTPFEYGGDLKPQGFPFFTEFKNLISIQKLLRGILPFYSWDIFLGTNFWASKAYYIMGDFFSYLSLAIPLRFYSTYALITGLKILGAGVLFFFYLSQFTTEHRASLIGALMYAFSSWVIYFFGQTTFVSYYALLPLLLLGVELYLQRKYRFLFLISVSVLLLTNFLFFFSTSVFLPLYVTYRYIQIHKGLRGFLKFVLGMVFLYLAGVMITGVLILPAFYYMLGNDRIGDTMTHLFFADPRVNLHLLTSLFVPSHAFIYGNNVFETGYHISREIVLWSGSLAPLLIPQVLTDKDPWFKRTTLVFYALLACLLFVPFGDSLMNGLSEYSFRWVLLLIALNIVTMTRYLSDFSRINQTALKWSWFLSLCLVSAVVPLTLLFLGQISQLSQYFPQWSLFLYVGLWLTFFYWVLRKEHKWKYAVMILFTALELFQYAYYNIGYFRKIPLGTWEDIENVTHVLQDNPNELNDYLKGLDPENPNQYYRVYVPHESLYWNYSHNMSVFYQLNGLMTYDTTYATSLNDLKHLAPQITEFGSSWIYNIKDPILMDFLNVKYAIVTQESEVPFRQSKMISDNFRGSLIVYENLGYRPLGTSYSSVTDGQPYYQNGIDDLSLLFETVLAKTEDIEVIASSMHASEPVFLENIAYADNHLSGSVMSEAQTFMILTLPYDAGWNITVNGTEVSTYSVNGGFIGFPLPSGQSQIEMYFVPQGFKTGFILSMLGLLIASGVLILDLKARKK